MLIGPPTMGITLQHRDGFVITGGGRERLKPRAREYSLESPLASAAITVISRPFAAALYPVDRISSYSGLMDDCFRRDPVSASSTL
jgi:hypothetical protein